MAPAVMFTGESGLERRSQENHSSLIYNTTVFNVKGGKGALGIPEKASKHSLLFI